MWDRSASERIVPITIGAGWHALVPGCPQWIWGERHRSMAFLGGYISAAVVAFFTWGTWPALISLLGAFATHVTSTADAAGRAALPSLGRWSPWLSSSAGLAVIYAPIIVTAWTFAHPVYLPGGEAFLVNCRAYGAAEPKAGDWVWFDPPPGVAVQIGLLRAVSGQELRSSGQVTRIEGRDLPRDVWTNSLALRDLALSLPPGYLLLEPAPDTSKLTDTRAERVVEGPVIIEESRVLGRAFAQQLPVSQRRLLALGSRGGRGGWKAD